MIFAVMERGERKMIKKIDISQADYYALEVKDPNILYNIIDRWLITENGCVITCPNCGHRLELCYPDGTEVRYLPHCPYCGKKLEK